MAEEKVIELPNSYQVRFKSGDDESFVEKLFEYDGKFLKRGKPIELNEDLTQLIENAHHDIIFRHDHDRNSGVGYFNVIDGSVSKNYYQQDED